MLKTNTASDVALSGLVKVDAGDGVALDIPTTIAARLAALEYDSGWRNINSFVTGWVSGDLRVRRIGKIVHIQAYQLIAAEQATPGDWAIHNSLIPSGFRVDLSGFTWMPVSTQPSSQNLDVGGPFRIDRFGHAAIYQVKPTRRLNLLASWTTADAIPSPLPGTPV